MLYNLMTRQEKVDCLECRLSQTAAHFFNFDVHKCFFLIFGKKYLEVTDVSEDEGVADGNLLPDVFVHRVDVGLIDTHAFLCQG